MNLIRENVSFYLLLLLIVTYVLGLMLAANISLGLFFLSSFLVSDFKKRFISAIRDLRVWCFSTLFFLTLLGVIHSEDVSEGFKYVEMKVAILLLPFPLKIIKLSNRQFNLTLVFYISVCFIATLIGLGNGFINYLDTGEDKYFYNNWLTYPINSQAVYFSTYLNLSIIFIVFLNLKGFFKNKGLKILAYSLIAYFLIFSAMLASRLSMVIIYIIGLGYLVYWIKTQRKFKMALILLGGIIVLLVIMLIAFPKTFKRFKSITNTEFNYGNMKSENHFNEEISDKNWNGLTLRLAIWSCAKEIIKDNPVIGVGTGDYTSSLYAKYREKGFYYGIKKQYTAHNTYLYVLISFGFVGLAIYTFSLIYPLMIALKDNNALYLIFLFLLLSAFLTENMLGRYIGIIFFTLFNGLLAFQPIKANN